MRKLFLNNQNVDIDDETAIGITFQSVDLKTPGQRRAKITNTFTIPLTANNLRILDYAGNAQWIGEEVNSVQVGCAIYNPILCDYWVNNEQLLKNAYVRIEEISERISIVLVEKADVWDELKNVSWIDFCNEWLAWSGLPVFDTLVETSLDAFISPYLISGANPFLPLFFSNKFGNIEDVNKITLNYIDDVFDDLPSISGGHFCLHIEKIFEFIEQKFNVNFLTRNNATNKVGSSLAGNIFNDQYAQKFLIPIRCLAVCGRKNHWGTEFWFEIGDTDYFEIGDGINDKNDKTLYDIVDCFLKYFDIIADNIELNGYEVIALRRFDDIEKYGEIKDLSDKMTGMATFKPLFSDYKQNNYIKHSKVYGGGNEYLNSKNITSKNLNSDVTADLFEINDYIPSAVQLRRNIKALDLSAKESFPEISCFIYNTNITQGIKIQVQVYDVVWGEIDIEEVSKVLNVAQLYDLNSEYILLDKAVKYPKFYTAKFWLTTNDVRNLEFFKLYYVKQLNASFFLNKISEFNPEKSLQPTTVELFKISDRSPLTPPEAQDYYVDFLNDGYTDLLGDYYY